MKATAPVVACACAQLCCIFFLKSHESENLNEDYRARISLSLSLMGDRPRFAFSRRRQAEMAI